MKILKKFFFIYLFFFQISFLYAEDKVVFLDIDFLLAKSNFGQEISIIIEEYNSDQLQKLQIKKNLLIDQELQLDKTKNIISKEDFKKKYELLKKNIDEYNKQKDEVFDSLNKKKNDQLKVFFERINPLIQDYMSQNSISLILNKKNIFIGRENIDITNEILDIINKNI